MIRFVITIFIAVVAVFEDMMQSIVSFFDWMWERVWSNAGLAGAMLLLFVTTQAALISLIPTIIGSVAFGLFAGTAIGKAFIATRGTDMDHVIDKGDPVVETEIVPYDKWPSECYVCYSDIPDDMNIRGQFVIHKGESQTKTKAVPLCEECTWTHSTLVDNHDTLVEIYDEREEPTEL